MRHFGARAGFFRDRFRQFDQLSNALWERAPVGGEFSLMADVADAEQEREQAAVPFPQLARFKRQLGWLRRSIELLLDGSRVGEPVAHVPITRQPDDQR